jgi:hypothetical protein
VDNLGEVVEVDNEGSAVSSWRRLDLFRLIDLILWLHSVKEGEERERESEGEMFDSPTVAGTPSQEQEPHPNTTIAGTSPNHHHRKNTNPTTARTPPNHHHRNNHAPITKFSTSRRGFKEMAFEQSREGK